MPDFESKISQIVLLVQLWVPFKDLIGGDKLKIKVKPIVGVEVQNIYLVHLFSKKRSILWTSSLPSSQARVTPSKSLFLFCPRPLSVPFLIRTSGKSYSETGSAIMSCKWFLPFPLEIILEMIAIGFKALGPVWRRWNLKRINTNTSPLIFIIF